MRRLMFWLIEHYVAVKWHILGRYYAGLAVQARYLYRQSYLFKARYQEMSLDFAERAFDDDAVHFFNKARKEHILIRAAIMRNAILGREPRPYVLKEE